jgi:hypothetical protein
MLLAVPGPPVPTRVMVAAPAPVPVEEIVAEFSTKMPMLSVPALPPVPWSRMAPVAEVMVAPSTVMPWNWPDVGVACWLAFSVMPPLDVWMVAGACVWLWLWLGR